VDSIEDAVLQQLQAVDRGDSLDKATGDALKKRKLVTLEAWTTFKLTKGPKFALERKKQPTDLTTEMLKE
jgi:phenylalanyl-tRNA synthetase alpha chain